MPPFQNEYGNVFSLKLNAEKSTLRSMEQILIPIEQKAIHLHPR